MDLTLDSQQRSPSTCSFATSVNLSKNLLTEKICLARTSQYKSYIVLAVNAFKAQDWRSLKAVKDFFTVLPSPIEIEQVLAAAIYQIAKLDQDSYRWLLCHPHYLMPELDLGELALNIVLSRLHSFGFLQGQDFKLENSTKKVHLALSEAAKAKLLQSSSVGDRLLFKELLQLGN